LGQAQQLDRVKLVLGSQQQYRYKHTINPYTDLLPLKQILNFCVHHNALKLRRLIYLIVEKTVCTEMLESSKYYFELLSFHSKFSIVNIIHSFNSQNLGLYNVHVHSILWSSIFPQRKRSHFSI
jgi:hypothetical protein